MPAGSASEAMRPKFRSSVSPVWKADNRAPGNRSASRFESRLRHDSDRSGGATHSRQGAYNDVPDALHGLGCAWRRDVSEPASGSSARTLSSC